MQKPRGIALTIVMFFGRSLHRTGSNVFIHSFFRRHMVIELTVGCHELLLKNVEVFGNELVEVNAPDLTAEAGPSMSQRFMRCSNWSGIRARRLSSPLLASLYLSLKSVCFGMSNDYYPQSCCLSLYHAFVKHLGVWLEIGGDDKESAAYFLKGRKAPES